MSPALLPAECKKQTRISLAADFCWSRLTVFLLLARQRRSRW